MDYYNLLKEEGCQISLRYLDRIDLSGLQCATVGLGANFAIPNKNSYHTINRFARDQFNDSTYYYERLKDYNLAAQFDDRSRKYIEFNSKINFYPEGIEIVKYPEKFKVVPNYTKDELLDLGFVIDNFEIMNQINRTRILLKDEFGNFQLNRDNITMTEALDKVAHNLKVSRKQTLDKLYSYSLSNNWDYFLTLTFDQKEYDSSDINVISESYKEFQNILRKINKNIKSLFIVEYHKDLKHFHLHGFISGKLDQYCIEAFTPDTHEPIYDRCGNRVFNFDLWNFGYSTLVKLQKNYNKLRVSNYISKYINKGFETIPYGYNILFHSRGLNSRISVNVNLTDREITDFIFDYYYDDFAAIHDIESLSDYTKSSIYKHKGSGVISIFLTYKSAEVST